ncbi:MAG: ATP-binding protein [Granulosicoccaceae bacterium]
MSFNRLMASLLIVVFAGVVGLGFLLSQLYEVFDSQSKPMESLAYKSLGNQLALTLAGADDRALALQKARESTGFELSLVDVRELPLPEPLLQSLAAGEPLLLQAEGVSRERALSVYFSIPGSEQLLLIDRLPVEETTRADGMRWTLTLSFYAGLFAVVLVWLAPLVRRLSALRQVTQAFGRGDLERRLHTTGNSYIAAIESDFNQMADKIQDLMMDNRLLSRAVSHDLKTPLARLRFGVEMLGQDLSEDKRNKYAERVEQDLSEMESLVDTLLKYARMEDNRPSLQLERVDLEVFVPELLRRHANAQSVQFCSSVTQGGVVQADKRFLSMLLLNLINNAAQHAKSCVLLQLQREGDQLFLTVEDDGPGIPLDKRQEVFKPFVRLGDTSSELRKGHGMGLAIAQRLAGWHGAQLSLEQSSKLGGARAVLRFSTLDS